MPRPRVPGTAPLTHHADDAHARNSTQSPEERSGTSRNVTLYVDGRKAVLEERDRQHEPRLPLYIGSDIKGDQKDGAVDEVYVYDKALDAWQVEVLHGILSPPPSAGPSDAGAWNPPTPLPSP